MLKIVKFFIMIFLICSCSTAPLNKKSNKKLKQVAKINKQVKKINRICQKHCKLNKKYIVKWCDCMNICMNKKTNRHSSFTGIWEISNLSTKIIINDISFNISLNECRNIKE
tara:strand:- start:494 stop:829 length:336 start_codon:yes stop_codon:yes gene_type:complete